MAAPRGITIRWSSSHYRINVDDGVRVRIEVECATGMDTKVFAYRMLPLNQNTGQASAHFSHVCSPPDLADFPEDEPRVGYSPEWFRLDYIDVLLRSVAEAQELIRIVQEDVRSLKLTLDKMDVIFPTGTDVVGDDCEAISSSSSASEEDIPSSSSASLGSQQMLCLSGTTEQSVGIGAEWTSIRQGAGSPLGSSDSFGQSYSRVTLASGTPSQLLLVQGFDLSDLPDDAIIDGFVVTLSIRDATELGSSSSLSSQGAPCPRLTFLALEHPILGLGANKAQLECLPGPEWANFTFGGALDRWGFGHLTASDLKRGEFGVAVVVDNDYESRATRIDVDGAEICFYYRLVF